MVLSEVATALEPPLHPYEMTPVAENGIPTYFATPARGVKSGARALVRTLGARAPRAVATAVGLVVFEQFWTANLLGQDLGVGVRISLQNSELTSHVTTKLAGDTLVSPPIRTSGDMTFPLSLGYLGVKLLFTISEWTYASQAIRFTLSLELASDLPFIPRVKVARAPVHIQVSELSRGIHASAVASPADLRALLTLQQMQRGGGNALAGPQGNGRREVSAVNTFRDPLIEVFDSGIAAWGPNWREDRIIRPFANRPRPDGITRHSVDIGPQRGAGNVYVVGWLSDQETDFDFVLHMGNNFFGGWGDIDWRVQGGYANIDPFPANRAAKRQLPEENRAPKPTTTNGASRDHAPAPSEMTDG